MGVETIIMIVLLVLLIVALLIVPMFTNKRRARQTVELHNSLKPGDLVKTVGGIVGTIVEIRQISAVDKEMVLETGLEGSKTTMVFDIQALYQVMSRSSTIVPANDESEINDETAENFEQPEKRVVPDILADRMNESEPVDSAAQDTVAEPQEEPAQKNGPVKKSNRSKKTN